MKTNSGRNAGGFVRDYSGESQARADRAVHAPRFARIVFLALVVAAAGSVVAARTRQKYVVHEWGTFTSVQGGDGALLDWRPLETSRLPKFVYDWGHPGLGRFPAGRFTLTKQSMVTLQRMETPVIYFYSQQPRDVNVSVDFPKGTITEWFPQATQIGPSARAVPTAVKAADEALHKAGAKPDFTLNSWLDQTVTKESRARWANVHVLPLGNKDWKGSLRQDESGSHYFSARETDASFLQVDSLDPTNQASEVEKFLFYRGAGNFQTPLRVTMSAGTGADGAGPITVTNSGKEPLEYMFVLSIEKGAGKFMRVKRLGQNEQRTIEFDSSKPALPVGIVSEKLGAAMKDSLVVAGLYPREAAAMVKTWSDSWFQEEGFRVLYLLPRAWTDTTLPLRLDPEPRELTRVMVGRAEVLAPASQERLVQTLTQAAKGDVVLEKRAAEELKRLGRFAEPALQLASKNAPEAGQTGWKLLQAARQPPTVTASPLE